MVRSGAVDHLRGKLPGFAAGGQVGTHGNLTTAFPQGAFDDIQSIAVRATATVAQNATLAFAKYVKQQIALMSGGAGIVKFAESFLGKIPYVWGGSTLGPSGADCSGFVEAVYSQFGINAPRTSEAHGAWVRKSGATPGGLAFYHSPPGGADPGHVAIVADSGSVVSQGGGMGPTMERINFLPLLWTGVPPHGFPLPPGTGNTPLTSNGGIQGLMQATAASHWGWTGSEWVALNNLEMREAGYSLTATNPTSGAYGLAQFINGPSEYALYGGDSTSALGQITGMLQYIAQRYGDPLNAWAHEVAFGWYGGGGHVPGYASGGGVGSPGLTALAGSGPHGAPRMPSMTAAGLIPRYAGGGVLPSFFTNTTAMRASLADSEKREFSNLFGLSNSYMNVGAKKFYTPQVKHDIGYLWSKHNAEQHAYNRLSGSGLTPGNVAALGAAAAAESSVALRHTLSRSGAGGHPLWDANLRTALGQIMTAANTTGGGKYLPIMSAETDSFGGDIIIDATGRTIALAGGSVGKSMGGMIPSGSYDRGGYLPRGLSLAYNGTGRPEPVGHGGGEVHIHFHNHGVIGSQHEVENWLTTSVRKVVHGRGGGNVQRAFGSH
jgi:cell wall-associated NlpC family hydrolase